MKANFSVRVLAALASVAALTLGASGAAQAHGDNIYWSVGMSSPGVQLGFGNAPPVVMYPPVYMAPRPVVYMQPAPVIYGPPGWQPRHHGHHGWQQGYREQERFEYGRGERWEGRGH